MPDKRATVSPASKLRARCERVAKAAVRKAETKPGCDLDIMNALSGRVAPPKDAFLASFIEPRVKGASVVRQSMLKRLKACSSAAYAMTIGPPDMATPLEDLDINTLPFRRIKSDLKKAGVANAIGMIQLHSRPTNVPKTYEVYPLIRLIAYGEELDDGCMGDLQRRIDRRFDVRGESALRFRSICDEAEIGRAAAGLFDMGDAKPSTEDAAASWKRSRSLRDLRRFQALASAPFKQMCIATGDGERLLDKVIVEGKHLLKPLCTAREQVIHRDQVAGFIAAELVRLGLTNHRLPFIRVR